MLAPVEDRQKSAVTHRIKARAAAQLEEHKGYLTPRDVITLNVIIDSLAEELVTIGVLEPDLIELDVVPGG